MEIKIIFNEKEKEFFQKLRRKIPKVRIEFSEEGKIVQIKNRETIRRTKK